MILNIDTADKTFMVTKEPTPKVDSGGVQRGDKRSGMPMWTTELVCTDPDGGTIMRVNTSGKQPDLAVGDPVRPVNLVAMPWAASGRSGIAFKADRIDLDDEDDTIGDHH